MMLHRKQVYIALGLAVCLLALAPLGAGTASASEAETIHGAMTYLKTFTYGELRTPLSALEALVLRSGDDAQLQRQLENGFIALLEDADTTPHALQFIVRQLAVMGTAHSVPALAAHLDNPEVADGVVRALETMPAPEANAALRTAARELPYPHPAMTGYFQPKQGAIQALARIKDQDAVPVLMELVAHDAEEISAAAYEALGRIGGEAACAFLSEALEEVRTPPDALADACLRCAEAMVDAGDMASATALLNALDSRNIPGYLQAAVVNVRMMVEGVNQIALALQSGDKEDIKHVHQAGVHWLLRLDEEAISEEVAENLDEIDVELLELVFKALAFRGETAASQGVVRFIESGQYPELTEHAIEALAYVGDETALDVLMRIILEGEGGQVNLARESLARLRGSAVDERLMDMAEHFDDRERQLVAIQALGNRHAYDAAPLMLELAEPGDEAIQAAALRSLQTIGRLENMGVLLGLLQENPDMAGQIEPILVVMAQRNRHEMELTDTARHAQDLANVQEAHVQTLALSVLGRLGDNDTLAIVTEFLDADDRSLRNHAAQVLAGANNVSVLPALMQVINERPRFDGATRTAALRGMIRLLRQETTLEPEAKIAYLDRMKDLDMADDDARQLLSVAGSVPHLEVFDWLYAHRDVTPYPAEHYQALMQVAGLIAGAYPDVVRDAFENIDLTGLSENIRSQANHVLHIINNSRDYLTAWEMAGPYRENALVGEALFNTSFAPEFAGEEAVWRIIPVGVQGDAPGRIALGHIYPETYEQTVYLRTTINVDTATDAVLRLHSPNSLRVWLNGEEVQAVAMEQDLLPRHVDTPLALEAGDNEVMVAVIQYNAGYFVECQLLDADGNLLGDYEARVD